MPGILGTAALGRALKIAGGGIVAAVRWFVEGLLVCVQHPVTFFVIIVAFGVGWGWGHHYGTIQLRRLNHEIAANNRALDQRAKDAEAARHEAERKLVAQIATDAAAPQEPPKEPLAQPVAAPRRAAAHKPLVRVRNTPAVASAGSWLPSFLTDPPQRD